MLCANGGLAFKTPLTVMYPAVPLLIHTILTELAPNTCSQSELTATRETIILSCTWPLKQEMMDPLLSLYSHVVHREEDQHSSGEPL